MSVMELGRKPNDPSAGYMEEDSELEFSDGAEQSSDEDLGYAQQCTKDSSSDEFEKEMESQAKVALREALGTSLAELVNDGGLKPRSIESAKPAQATAEAADNQDKPEAEVEYYDDIYFDSESEEEESKGGDDKTGERQEKKQKKEKKKVRKLTNDELFYDPTMDDEDEKWVARQRMAYHNVKAAQELAHDKGKGTQSTVHPTMPTSDAVLNCPACMTTLCIDCQRHELYPQQYRAMFVMNCKILRGEVLKFAPKQDKRASKRKRRRQDEGAAASSNVDSMETFHPVHCSVCDTEVAVYDQNEVYHFFSVLASAP